MRMVLTLTLALMACSGDKDGGDSGLTTTSTGTPGDARITLESMEFDECRAASLHVSWTSDEEGESFVEYSADGGPVLTTPPDAGGTAHSAALRGLVNGETYTVQPITVTAAGERIEGPTQDKEVPFAPSELLPMSIDEGQLDVSRSEVYGGWVTLSTLGSATSYAAVLDPTSGQYTWWATVDDPSVLAVGRIKPSRDGQALLWNDYDRSRAVDVAHTYRMSHDSCDVVTTRNLWGHHDFNELPDGSHGWLGYTFNDAVPVEGYGTLPVMADNIYEAAEGSDTETPTEVWSALTDWDCPVYWTGGTMELGAWVPGYHEWSHGNSLTYVDDDDAYFMVMRYTDAIVKVDRATGTTAWTMGGPCGTITNAAGDTPFWSYPHFSHAWRDADGLHLLVFDNGDEYEPQVSRVVEYVVDEVAGSAEQVWEFVHPSGDFIRILGDARRLPGGNTLIAWSPQGVMQEVTPEGDTVWYASTGLGQTIGRAVFVPDIYAGVDGSP
ncbi:MAG: hypothetical protein ACI8PZ_000847 [Myxococcota bacterium]|jgi:hypothetical protein